MQAPSSNLRVRKSPSNSQSPQIFMCTRKTGWKSPHFMQCELFLSIVPMNVTGTIPQEHCQKNIDNNISLASSDNEIQIPLRKKKTMFSDFFYTYSFTKTTWTLQEKFPLVNWTHKKEWKIFFFHGFPCLSFKRLTVLVYVLSSVNISLNLCRQVITVIWGNFHLYKNRTLTFQKSLFYLFQWKSFKNEEKLSFFPDFFG